MVAKGIDVSHHQGSINWKAVKNAGAEFAILKAGGSDKGCYKDNKFESYYADAKANGIPVGAYYYVGSKCITRADGIADAKRFIDILKGKQFEYPVYIDLESTAPPAKAGATEATVAFCETMEEAGYFVGIYASDISGFKDRLDISKLSRWSKWVARYGSKPKFVSEYDVWQKSETGRINGISGAVDLDECYKDFPTVIKSSGKNGFEKTNVNPVEETASETSPEKPVETVVNPVEEPKVTTDTPKTQVTAKGLFDVLIICNSLNMRTGPSLSAKSVGIARNGETYTIIETKNNWGKIKDKNLWISILTKYVKKL